MHAMPRSAELAESSSVTRVATSHQLLDSFRLPLLLADRRRKVIHANPAACELTALGDPFALRSGTLVCPQYENQTELSTALDNLFRHADADHDHARKRVVLSLSLRDGKRVPVVLLTLHRRSSSHHDVMTHRVLICVSRAPGSSPDVPALQRIFGLTRAEARLAAAIAAGASPAICARELNVKISTVRTQLNSVYRKTGSRTQAQLVAQTLSLAIV